jgi:uncharacterized protein GlcG (DUF336 family)
MARSVSFAWSLAALVALTGPAAAQLEKFIIQGPAAEKMLEKNALSLETAKAIAAVCNRAATERGSQASIVILDQFGQLVYFERMNGIRGVTQIDAAIRKAKTSLVTLEPSRATFNRIQNGQFTDFHMGYWHDVFKTPGGLPIIVDKQLLGAIGVGGSGFDERCAYDALTAVIGPQPPLPPVLPAPAAPAAN